MGGTFRPTRGVTQDVQPSDGNGGFITPHIQSGLIISVTCAPGAVKIARR